MGIEKVGLQLGKEITAWTRSGKSLLATTPVKINTAGLRLAPQIEKDVVETSAKKGLCHEFWSRMFKDGNIYSAGTPTLVEYHAELHSFNGMLNNLSPINLNREITPRNHDITVAEVIKSTDVDFKAVSPITGKVTAYRCLTERPSFLKEATRLYKKASKIKPGEITVMREYAYCTPDKGYAKCFLGDKGIIYEISLPAGARISQRYDEYVLPRYSRFKCISNETLENGSHKIKLEYILPDESWRNA